MLVQNDYDYLRHVLDEAYDRLKNVYLETSVLGPVRVYSAESSTEKEFWALFCALVDFQMPVVDILNPMLKGLVYWMEERGIRFIHLIHDEGLARNVFSTFQWIGKKSIMKGFTHRLVKIDDLIILLRIFKRIINDYGSLGVIVKDLYESSLHLREPMENVFSKLVEIFRKHGGRPPLIPIRTSSPLKRLNLFMRWMVRPYPDLGLWTFINKKHLLVALNKGLHRVLSRAFDIGIGMNWNGVLKVTEFLRRINPEDPAKYDYLLSRISIMKYCAKNPSRSRCFLCPLMNVCRSSRFKPKPKPVALKGRERKIFESFISCYGHEFYVIQEEYPLGNYTADVLLHKANCETYIAEVEERLNYSAIGQVLTYSYLYFKIRGKVAKPIIICSKIKEELKDMCEIEQGITVIEVNQGRC